MKKDMIDRLTPLLKHGWKWEHDGTLKMRPTSPLVDSPWANSVPLDVDCLHWQRAFWEFASGQQMVHSHCQECWKVVIYPRTVVELVKLYRWQQTLKKPCKCGCDFRTWTGHLYGGYHYTRSLAEGKRRYKQVRAWADKNLGEDAEVILKRGCTEFERAVGPSDDWKVTEGQKIFEAQFDAIVIPEPCNTAADHFVERYLRGWITFAYSRGDTSYLQLTGGKKLHPDYVTYHKEEGAEDG